jgi:hypothetical protein
MLYHFFILLAMSTLGTSSCEQLYVLAWQVTKVCKVKESNHWQLWSAIKIFVMHSLDNHRFLKTSNFKTITNSQHDVLYAVIHTVTFMIQLRHTVTIHCAIFAIHATYISHSDMEFLNFSVRVTILVLLRPIKEGHKVGHLARTM